MKSQTHDTTIKAWMEFSGAEHGNKKKTKTLDYETDQTVLFIIKEIKNSAWAEPFAGLGFP